jgi:hypothetical protein
MNNMCFHLAVVDENMDPGDDVDLTATPKAAPASPATPKAAPAGPPVFKSGRRLQNSTSLQVHRRRNQLISRSGGGVPTKIRKLFTNIGKAKRNILGEMSPKAG